MMNETGYFIQLNEENCEIMEASSFLKEGLFQEYQIQCQSNLNVAFSGRVVTRVRTGQAPDYQVLLLDCPLVSMT